RLIPTGRPSPSFTSTANWWAAATLPSRCTRAASSSSCWPRRAPSRLDASLAGRGFDLQGSHRRQTEAACVEDPLELVAHGTEEICGALGGAGGGMRRGGVPLVAGREGGAHQHRLPEGNPAQGGGVETRERMKGVALDLSARDRRVQEIQIEKRIVPHQHRARA